MKKRGFPVSVHGVVERVFMSVYVCVCVVLVALSALSVLASSLKLCCLSFLQHSL